jgi:hypothetical protein
MQSRGSRDMFKRYVLPPSSELMMLIMEAVRTSETLVYFYETTWPDISEGCYLHTRRPGNLKFYISAIVLRSYFTLYTN